MIKRNGMRIGTNALENVVIIQVFNWNDKSVLSRSCITVQREAVEWFFVLKWEIYQ